MYKNQIQISISAWKSFSDLLQNRLYLRNLTEENIQKTIGNGIHYNVYISKYALSRPLCALLTKNARK